MIREKTLPTVNLSLRSRMGNTQFRVVAAILIAAILLSTMVLISWVSNILFFLTLVEDGASMKFNTALCFMLIIIALLIKLYAANKRGSIISNLLLLFVSLLASLTLAEYLFHINIGIDNFFVEDPFSQKYPGRMSPATSFCFLLLAISNLSQRGKAIRSKLTYEGLVLMVLLICITAVFGYILQIPASEIIPFLNTMALHTSILFIVLSLITSLVNNPSGFASFLLGKHQGSRLLRWVLPFLLVFPLALGYWLLYAVNHTEISLEFGIVMCALICSVVCILYIVMVAIRLNKAEDNRRLLEESLHRSNKQLSQFKDALDASSIVAVTDARGVITYVNDKFCEISKYDREEVIGKTHRLINSGYHSKAFFRELWQKISRGEVWVGGIKNRAKDGSFYWVHTAIIPFRDEDGKIVEYLAIRQDITKHKLLSTQYENLKLKNKEIEQFTYIASHDLQEPLRTMQSMISIVKMQEEDNLQPESVMGLHYIEQAAGRMSDLIKGLLDYSRIGVDKKLTLINCDELVRAVMDDLGQIIAERKAHITIGPLPELNGYEMELRLLFQNLLNNAIKFSRKDKDPEVEICAKLTGDYYRFSITDNGIGIKDEHNRNIFGIFQRLNNRSEFEGTGIGLAHCEKIIHLHGGDIWVKSKPDEGSTFYFTIPVNLK